MPFSIKRFTMHRSTSLPGGRSQEGGKKISLTEIREPRSSSSKKADKNKAAQPQPPQSTQQAQQPLPNSRSMDAGELRRLGFGPPPELLADAMASASRTLHAIQEHPSGPLRNNNTATLPARWRSGGAPPPRPSSEMRGSFGGDGGGGTEVRRLVVRKNGVRFQESDWAVDDNHSIGSNKLGGRGGGGPPTIRPPSSLSKRAAEWENDHLSERGSQTLKRPQPRQRHHTVGFETGSMTTLPRASMDLESHLPNQRSHSLYQPPSSVYDEDPGIMSEVETSATGFRRASKARSSLPIVRTPSKTQERPLGLVFLQYQSETKRALLPNEITSMDTVRALFVRSFPKQLTMEYLDSPHIRVYIHDPAKDMFYELEDLRDIRDRSVLRIYEQDMNGGGVYSTYDQDLSYFSEPEFDSEYQHQHIHRSKASKAPLPPTYYGTLPPQQYLPSSRTLPHSASMRSTYSPDRKTQTLPPGGGTIPEETETLEGGTLPPPKPQRSFQQALTPLGKTVRSTPPPTGPPPSIPSPRSGQPLVAIGSNMPISPERRHDGTYRDRPYSVAGTYQPQRYEYHSSPERRPPTQQESGYLSSPERRMDRSGYSTSSSYEDSLYGGSIYGTRSGSVTPVIDEEARLRMEYMERQLASLTGLVQKALTTGPPPNKSQPPQPIAVNQQIPTRDCDLTKGNGTIKKEDKHVPVIKPSLHPKPSHLPVIYDRGEHATPKEVHLTPEMYCQLRHLRKQTKDLRLEVRNLRRIAQAQSVTARDTVRETCLKIKTMLSQAQSGEDQVCAERLRVSREEDLYRLDVTRLEKDLTELETHVEELRSNVINRKCRVNMSDVEGMALVLSRASKTVADLKARFPNLQDSLKSVMAAEMEVVVREEKFLKEEPDRLETALRRCKKLTGTLVTLKRLASVQEQRHTGALPGNPEKSSEGNQSDGELHNVKTISSDPHTVIHVPPGHQQQHRGSENALDALLDELQTFTKPLEQQPRDNIPGLLGPQKRLPSYPSSESPVRSPNYSPSVAPPDNSAFRAPATITSKLQVVGGDGQRLSPSHSPVPPPTGEKKEVIARVGVNPGGNAAKQTLIDGVEGTVTNPPSAGAGHKKAPPPPPPRTTSRSPLTSPAAEPGSPREVAFGSLRSNSAPETAPKAQKGVVARSASTTDATAPREALSSNSSSSESVNSQEGLSVRGGSASPSKKPATPTRVDALEQRHQELLRKQKLLQDQYTRLQQLQSSQILQRFSPPVLMNDLKKTGSESNILSKSGLSVTASSGSLTHLAGSFNKAPPPDPKPKAPAVPAKPGATQVHKNKIYETDIL